MQKDKMLITILGCGTSTGVPLIHCSCKVCRSKNPKNKRLRASLWIQVEDKNIIVDVAPDFRQQALRAKIPRIDAFIITHPHADHVGGIDEIRSYNFIQKETIPMFGHDWTIRELPVRFPYIFKKTKIEGGGVSKIALNEFDLDAASIKVAGIKIIPIPVEHGSERVAGIRIGNFAYLTDCNSIPESSMKKLEGLEVLILDCLRVTEHDTHLHFQSSMRYSRKIGAKKTIFTHMGHDFDFDLFSKQLEKERSGKSEKFLAAYDGMKIKV